MTFDEDALRASLRAVHSPVAPPDLAATVMKRGRRVRTQRRVAAVAGACAAGVAAVWLPWAAGMQSMLAVPAPVVTPPPVLGTVKTAGGATPSAVVPNAPSPVPGATTARPSSAAPSTEPPTDTANASGAQQSATATPSARPTLAPSMPVTPTVTPGSGAPVVPVPTLLPTAGAPTRSPAPSGTPETEPPTPEASPSTPSASPTALPLKKWTSSHWGYTCLLPAGWDVQTWTLSSPWERKVVRDDSSVECMGDISAVYNEAPPLRERLVSATVRAEQDGFTLVDRSIDTTEGTATARALKGDVVRVVRARVLEGVAAWTVWEFPATQEAALEPTMRRALKGFALPTARPPQGPALTYPDDADQSSPALELEEQIAFGTVLGTRWSTSCWEPTEWNPTHNGDAIMANKPGSKGPLADTYVLCNVFAAADGVPVGFDTFQRSVRQLDDAVIGEERDDAAGTLRILARSGRTGYLEYLTARGTGTAISVTTWIFPEEDLDAMAATIAAAEKKMDFPSKA